MYFDPGTGSMIVQILVASIAGVGAFFLTFKTNCISFIKGIFKKNGKQGSFFIQRSCWLYIL